MCAFKKHRRLRGLIFHAAGAETTSVDRKSFMATKKTLTEQELLAMSDKDYMNDKQLEFFRNRLTEMEAELRHNAGQTTENLRESTVVPDPADRATIEEEHALELRTRDRERKLLKKVQAAIKRIDEGEYGYCEETGEPIPESRLEAIPFTRCTKRGQEIKEAETRKMKSVQRSIYDMSEGQSGTTEDDEDMSS